MNDMSLVRRKMMMRSDNENEDYSTWRGVYIETIDGKLHSEDEGKQSDANGIAVLTDNCRFVIGLYKNYYASMLPKYTSASSLPNFGSSDAAKTDYNGKYNTELLMNIIGNTTTSTAAEDCVSYVFPNGNTGYLGAVGEWQAVLDNLTDINWLLSIHGGDTISQGERHWTSTRCGTNFWYTYTGDFLTASGITYAYMSRAFTTLKSDSEQTVDEG